MITGVGGFLGKAILDELIKHEKYEVLALTSQVEKMQSQYAGVRRIHFFEYTSYREIDFAWIDYLISCAFPTKAEDGTGMAQGLAYVCQLLNYANDSGVRHIIDISTQSVYGTLRKQKADETTEINLDTKYAIGKYYTEIMLNDICKNCLVTHYRIASLIGPGFDQRITNIMIKNVIQGLPIRVVDGAQVMGYMDVRDAADAIVSSLEHLDVSDNKQIYNIAAESYSLSYIAESIMKIGKEFHVKEQAIVYEETGKVRDTSVDASKFQTVFQWKPQYKLEDAVREIYKVMLKDKKQGCSGERHEI